MFWTILLGAIGMFCAIVAIQSHFRGKRAKTINSITSGLESDNFIVSKQVVDGQVNFSLLIDDVNQKWAIVVAKSGIYKTYNYSDLVEYELLENGNSVSRGVVGGATISGTFLGGFGGVTSTKTNNTCNNISLRIVTNLLNDPLTVIPLLNFETEVGSWIYNSAIATAREFAALLAIIKTRAEKEKGIEVNAISQSNMKVSTSDEIEKLYSLKEKSIITEEEFEQKKKQLLGL